MPKLFRFEHKTDPLLARSRFVRRVSTHLGAGVVFVVLSLIVGMFGYHHTEHLSWLDSYLNAAMILSGMGPLCSPQTDVGKVFAGTYALFSGFAVLAVAGVMLAPFIHRMLHVVHAEPPDDSSDD